MVTAVFLLSTRLALKIKYVLKICPPLFVTQNIIPHTTVRPTKSCLTAKVKPSDTF